MKICFFTIPLFGHNHYGLKIAKALMKNGHEVHFYTGKRYEELVRKRGVTYHNYPQEVEKLFETGSYNSYHTRQVDEKEIDYYQELFLLGVHLFSITDALVKNELERYQKENYDAIVFDNIAIWGGKIARLLHVPCFASGTPYVYNRKMIEAYPREFGSEILRDFSASGRSITRFLNLCDDRLWKMFPDLKDLSITTNYAGSGDVNFIYTTREFQLHQELLDEKYEFVGIMQEEPDFADSTDLFQSNQKSIYLSLGTVYNNIEVYNLCINALRGLDYNIIISIGSGNQKSDFDEIPDEWYIEKSVPQLEVLKQTDLFITHGGTNSVREAANYGVPMIVFPQTTDQFLTGIDVEREGIGTVFESMPSVEELRAEIESVMMDDQKRENCRVMAELFQKLGGINRVIEVIERYSALREANGEIKKSSISFF